MTVVSLMLRSLPLVLLLLSFDGIGQELKVMTFNIWHGGRETGEEEGPRRVVDVIRDSGADVVAMQETYGSGARIAEALGYHLYLRSANLSIMSRYPIVDTLDAYEPFNSGAVIIDVHGKQVVVASNWLNFPFDYWDMLEKDEPIDSAQWQRAFSGEKNTGILREILNKLNPAIENSGRIPVIICGDFNSGSHLDWIKDARDLNKGYVMPFPATLLMESRGFTDAYRAIYQAPLMCRGITWTPIRQEAHQDRIDYVFYKGSSIRPTAAEVINTHAEVFPSDHAAVVVTFYLTD